MIAGILIILHFSLFFLVSHLLRATGLAFASVDDFPRLTLAMGWGLDPFFDPGDGFWLPLYFCIYGSWYKLAGNLMDIYWFVPLSVLLISVSIVMIQLAAQSIINSSGKIQPGRIALFSAITLLLAFSIPFLCRLTGGGLSEIPVLFFLGMYICLLIRLSHKPGIWSSLLCLVPLACLQMLRYEYWLLAPLLWIASLVMLRRAGRTIIWQNMILVAGLCCLSTFPLTWLTMNHVSGRPAFHFIQQAHQSFYVNSNLPDEGIAWRLAYVCTLVMREGWLILLFGCIGVRNLFHLVPVRIITVIAIINWLMVIYHAFGPSVGTVTFERHLMAPLIITMPLAVPGLIMTLDQFRRNKQAAGTLLLPLLFIMQFCYNTNRRWGGSIFNQYVTGDVEWLYNQARNHDHDIVIEDPEKFDATLHVLKVYCGLNRVKIASWYDQVHPEPGRFLYLSPTHSLLDHEPERRVFNWHCYRLTRMPP
jgi:hypothetical protein